MLSLLTRGILLIAVLVSFGLIAYAVTYEAGPISLAVGLGLWAVSPYISLYLATRKRQRSVVYDGAVLAASTTAAISGLWIYTNILFIDPDAQGGLVLIFTPLYQWFGIALLFLALGSWSLLKRWRIR